MALVTVPGGLWIPQRWGSGVAAFAFTNQLIDASGEKVGYIFRVPKTGTLDKFEFRAGTVTVNAASQIRCSFQDPSVTTGDPDEVQDQFRDIAGSAMVANGWNVPGLITSDGTDTGVKRSVTQGDLLAAVIEYQTFTAGDTIQVSAADIGSQTEHLIDDCYVDLKSGAGPSWAKSTGAAPNLGLKYNDGSYAFIGGADAMSELNTNTYNNGSTPDERALRFSLPVPFRLGGCWVRLDLDAVADIVLYDSDGTTALATVSLDPDIRQSAAGRNRLVRFASDISLLKDTVYRLSVKPTSVTNISMYDKVVNGAAIMDAYEGGQNFHWSQRTDAGAWTQTTTKRPGIGLFVTALDDGAAAGLLVHPGMTGGMRG